jgi:hypothetical protein
VNLCPSKSFWLVITPRHYNTEYCSVTNPIENESFLCLKNGGRNRRKCECGTVKGVGHLGVQSECSVTTCFRRLVPKDSCFEHEQLLIQSVWKCTLCVLFRCARTLICITTRLHLHVCTDWSSVLLRNSSSPPRCEAHCGWWRNLLRTFWLSRRSEENWPFFLRPPRS